VSFWILIPMMLMGYLLVGFLSGMFFAAISRAKKKPASDFDERFENLVGQALFWPIAFPCYLLTNVGRVFGIVFCSYADLLEHVHGKTHKIG
jgi:hypothetical protein